VDVSEDMLDPWLARVVFAPSIETQEASFVLRGENALEAVWIGMHKTYYFVLQVYRTMERMIFTRSLGVDSISGPLGIIDMGGKVAQAGWVKFLFFLGIISANLAVINFLPLPIVDGGLMVFLLIEKIKGSPVSMKVQVATQVLGLFLIIGMFIFVTYQDALRLWG
jgi:regulator of sigma E protease